MSEPSNFSAVMSNPLNLIGLSLSAVLLAASVYVLRSWFKSNRDEQSKTSLRSLPKMKRQDFYVKQLAPYNGVDNERILIAVNFKVFDVSNRGRDFYGPGGPYHCFAGKDASRALAKMSLADTDIKEEYDDLADLSSSQMSELREWENQFKDKYDYIGRLISPDETPKDYSETEESSGIHEN